MKIYRRIRRQLWTIKIIAAFLAFLLGEPGSWAQEAATDAPTPPPAAEAGVGAKSNAQGAVDYFYAVRNPAPAGTPAKAPVPLAVQAAEAKRAEALQDDRQAEVQQAGFTPVWRPVGDSTDSGQIPGGGRVSGRVYGITPDPGDETGSTLYIATAFGGVWMTSVGGRAWTPLTDQEVSLATTAVVVDPGNSQRVFAATGDRLQSNYNYGSPICIVPPMPTGCTFFGNGILYSPSGGAPGTWTTIGGVADADLVTRDKFVGHAIYDLAISPDGQELYVATTKGFWTATWDGLLWHLVRRDTGISRREIWTTVRVNPDNPDLVHTANAAIPFGEGGGVWVYNRRTFTLTPSAIAPPVASAAIGRTTIAVDPNDGTHVYASMECLLGVPAAPCPQVAVPPPPQCRGGGGSVSVAWWGVYESTDSGAFQPLVTPATLPPPPDPCRPQREFRQADYDLTLGVDPLDGDFLYIGLVNLWAYRLSTGVAANISSPNPPAGSPLDCNAWGAAWAAGGRRRFQLEPGIHCDQQAMAFGGDGTLYVVNDGGVFASPPGSRGGEWRNLNSNLQIQQFFPGISYDDRHPNRLLGGTQDNGTQTWSGGRWQTVESGDGGFTAFAYSDPANSWYASHTQLRLVKTLNGSTPWSETSGPLWVSATQGMAPQRALFIAPFVILRGLDNLLLAGADVPYVTTDGAARWRDVHGNLPVRPLYQEISATTICVENETTFYIGTADGEVFWSRNVLSASPTWTQLGDPEMGGPTRWITRIVCTGNGVDNYGVFVTVGGSALPEGYPEHGVHVYRWTRSTNRWEPVRGMAPNALPNTTVATLAIDPRSQNQGLYAATDLGVYASMDGGATWTRYGGDSLSGSLPRVPVVDLKLDSRHLILWAATHGRGVWAALLPPRPDIAAITPRRGPASGGTRVTITGAGFDSRPGRTKFFFHGRQGRPEALNVTCMSDTSCTVDAPPYTADYLDYGFTPVNVQAEVGGLLSGGPVFTYRSPPTIETNLGIGPERGGTRLHLDGSGYSTVIGETVVRFGATAAQWVTCFDHRRCLVIIPPGTGTVSVTVTVDGLTSGPGQFRYYPDSTRPVVTGISPDRGPASGGTPVRITGTGLPLPFETSYSIMIGSATLREARCDATVCTGVTPGGTGTDYVWVYYRGLWSDLNPAARFSYINPEAPRITSISPNSGGEAGGTRVTIRGANFRTEFGGTFILFGGGLQYYDADVRCPTSTECTATTLGGVGTVYVVAQLFPGGMRSMETDDARFTYLRITEPVAVTGVSPTEGSAAGGTEVTVSGQGFDPNPGGTRIGFRDLRVEPYAYRAVEAVCTPGSCTARTPPGAGTVGIFAFAHGQTSQPNPDVQFGYIPQVTRVDPPAGVASGSTIVTITGSGLGNLQASQTSVSFGPYLATEVVCNAVVDESCTRVTAKTPAGAGAVDVQVTVDDRTSPANPAAHFTFIPVVASLQPQLGVTTGGTVVRIGGAGFKPGATTIRFGSSAASANCESETECTTTSPPGTGTVDVTATVDGQTSATGPFSRFRYVAGGLQPPAVTGVDPSEGPEAGGTTVTITGVRFDPLGGTTVKFGSTPATDVVCTRSTVCTATSPPGTGVVHVTVTVGALTSAETAADQFTYLPDKGRSGR